MMKLMLIHSLSLFLFARWRVGVASLLLSLALLGPQALSPPCWASSSSGSPDSFSDSTGTGSPSDDDGRRSSTSTPFRSLSPVQLDPISPAATVEFLRMAQIIKARCAGCVIGVGRSPAPVSALLEAVGTPVVQLPLSGLRAMDTPRLGDVEGIRLEQHLTTFLPPGFYRDKHILLVDFTVTGNSLLAARSFVEDFARKRSEAKSSAPVVDILAFAHMELTLDERLSPRDAVFIEKRVYAQFHLGKYKPYAQYEGQYRLGDRTFVQKENPLYTQLREDFKRRLAPLLDPRTLELKPEFQDLGRIRTLLSSRESETKNQGLLALALSPRTDAKTASFAIDKARGDYLFQSNIVALISSLEQLGVSEKLGLFAKAVAEFPGEAKTYAMDEFLTWFHGLSLNDQTKVAKEVQEIYPEMREDIRKAGVVDKSIAEDGREFLAWTKSRGMGAKLEDVLRYIQDRALTMPIFEGATEVQKRKLEFIIKKILNAISKSVTASIEMRGEARISTEELKGMAFKEFRDRLYSSQPFQTIMIDLAKAALSDGRILDAERLLEPFAAGILPQEAVVKQEIKNLRMRIAHLIQEVHNSYTPGLQSARDRYESTAPRSQGYGLANAEEPLFKALRPLFRRIHASDLPLESQLSEIRKQAQADMAPGKTSPRYSGAQTLSESSQLHEHSPPMVSAEVWKEIIRMQPRPGQEFFTRAAGVLQWTGPTKKSQGGSSHRGW